jgi:hypothetical protein
MEVEVVLNSVPVGNSYARESGSSPDETACTVTQCCVLDWLFSVSFGALSFEEKMQIIANGRPTPDISAETKVKGYTRHFKIDYYNASKWLTACKTRNKLYCWPCVLFQTDKAVWNNTGFCDMNNFHKAKLRHETTHSHLSSIILLKTFGTSRIDVQLSEQKRLNIIKHNAEVDSNRELMKRLIDVCCFIAKQELPFRGHNEREDSLNCGNYIELTQLLAKYDSKLELHLQSSGAFKGTSNRIQNDIIECVGDVIMNKIKSEISDALFLAIMLDETTDIAKSSQLSTVIRYVKDGNVCERFIGFADVSSDRTATAVSEHVFRILALFNCDQKLVAQGYDGAATFSGHLNGVQSLVKKRCPSALFIHCYAHRLNLVLSQSVNHVSECKIFFKTLSGIPIFFSHSAKRTNALNQSDVKRRFPTIVSTRWNYNSRIVNTVSENKIELIRFFDRIAEDPDSWDTDAFMTAKGYSLSLRDFDFAFLLNVFSHIFSLTDILFKILQTKTFDVKYCIDKVKETISHIRDARNDFEEMYTKLEDDDNVESPKKRRRDDPINTRNKYCRLYYEIIDTVVGQMEVRFQDLNELQFLALLDSQKFESFKVKFPENLLLSLKSSYGSLFHVGNLRCELVSVYRLSDFSNKTVIEMMKFLKETDLAEEAFPETYKLCSLVSTIPVSTATVERTFSCMKRIKTTVRNSQSENRLSTLSLLSIEKGLLDELQSQKSFYDSVIDIFTHRR